MNLRSSLAIISDNPSDLDCADVMLTDESILVDMVESLDVIPELSTGDTTIYRCECNGDSWINIYDVLERLNGTVQDVLYCTSDGKNYVEVISTSGLFDVYVDSSQEKIEGLCATYGLEYFGSSDEDDYEDDFNDEDEWN